MHAILIARLDVVQTFERCCKNNIFTHLVPGDWPLYVELRILTVQKG